MISQSPEFLTGNKGLFPLDPKLGEPEESPPPQQSQPLLELIAPFLWVLSVGKWWIPSSQKRISLFSTEKLKDFGAVSL